MFSLIREDCYRYAGKIGIKEFLINKGLRFTFFLRMAGCVYSVCVGVYQIFLCH
jgi:hypothetical protein